MKNFLIITICCILMTSSAIGQNDSILYSDFNKLHIKPTTYNISLYTEVFLWGLVGYSNKFVVDATEICNAEWLEYIYYHNYEKMPTYTRGWSVNEKNITPEEKDLLLNTKLDTSLFPIKEVLDNLSQSYVFTKCKSCSFLLTDGLHGKFLLPVESDSFNNENSLKRLKYYLEIPITGISYEQAKDFCKWRTEVDSVIASYNPDMVGSWTEAKSRLWDENTQMRCYKYDLPTPDQFDEFNFSLDSNSKYKKYISGFNYENSRYSKKHRTSETNIRSGHLPIRVFDYAYPASYLKGYRWIINSQGNVAEMTSIKGVARGGSYFHPAKDSYPGINNNYTKPEAWLGFRCIGIKYRVFDY